MNQRAPEALNIAVLGHEGIDAQHRQIFAWLDEIEVAHREGQGYALISRTLNRLKRYADDHFALEEQLMLEVGYPRYQEHRRQHNQLSAQVWGLANDFEAEEPVLSIEVIMLLRQWLLEHINRMDADIVNYMPG